MDELTSTLTPEERAGLDGFLLGRWPLLGVEAYGRFLRHGRGALILPWTLTSRWLEDHDVTLPQPLVYANIPSFEPIGKYDPERQVVVVFLGDDAYRDALASASGIGMISGAAIWKVYGNEPAPPDLYKRAMRRFGN